jgi:alpha-D-ribose 1-methylphosphonate 5-phosphate C-P lyase
MQILIEQSLAFYFPDNWKVTKYDDWPFYKNQFKDCCMGCKAIDFLAIDPARGDLWLIEVKDYRNYRRTKEDNMWDEMALKSTPYTFRFGRGKDE